MYLIRIIGRGASAALRDGMMVRIDLERRANLYPGYRGRLRPTGAKVSLLRSVDHE